MALESDFSNSHRSQLFIAYIMFYPWDVMSKYLLITISCCYPQLAWFLKESCAILMLQFGGVSIAMGSTGDPPKWVVSNGTSDVKMDHFRRKKNLQKMLKIPGTNDAVDSQGLGNLGSNLVVHIRS